MKGKWNEWLPKIVSNPNWRQMWFLSALASLIWVCLASLIPDHHFKPVAVILTTVQTAVTFILRGGKFVLDRNAEIPDGPIVTPPVIPSGKIDPGPTL